MLKTTMGKNELLLMSGSRHAGPRQDDGSSGDIIDDWAAAASSGATPRDANTTTKINHRTIRTFYHQHRLQEGGCRVAYMVFTF